MSVSKKSSRRKQERILFVLMGLIIIGLIALGYFLFVNKLLPEFSEALKPSEAGNRPSAQAAEAPNEAKSRAAAAAAAADDDSNVVKVYFAKKGRDLLAYEEHRIRKDLMLASQAKKIIEILLKNPADTGLYKILPDGAKLRGLFYNSGVFLVDLSLEFEKIFDLGAAEQVLAVYSIVNSLTELDPNAGVRFLINGVEPKNDKGSVDMLADMTRLNSIIE